jgi:hypothetical protein
MIEKNPHGMKAIELARASSPGRECAPPTMAQLGKDSEVHQIAVQQISEFTDGVGTSAEVAVRPAALE